MSASTPKRAVVLLSGGLDSTTCLAWAHAQGMECHTLAVDYGQRHRVELDAARRVAAALGSRDHREFLNPRNELYRERGMKENPPPRAQALKLMAENPNLIRRPIVVSGAKIVLGFEEKQYKEL